MIAVNLKLKDIKEDGDRMKLNKAILKEMIRDALREEEKFTTSAEKASSGDIRAGAMGAAKEQSSGLTDEERGLIKQLVSILTAAAKKTNLTSGVPAQKINQLATILKKIAGAEQQQPEQGAPQ